MGRGIPFLELFCLLVEVLAELADRDALLMETEGEKTERRVKCFKMDEESGPAKTSIRLSLIVGAARCWNTNNCWGLSINHRAFQSGLSVCARMTALGSESICRCVWLCVCRCFCSVCVGGCLCPSVLKCTRVCVCVWSSVHAIILYESLCTPECSQGQLPFLAHCACL